MIELVLRTFERCGVSPDDHSVVHNIETLWRNPWGLSVAEGVVNDG